MKKLMLIFLSILLTLSLAACGDAPAENPPDPEPEQSASEPDPEAELAPETASEDDPRFNLIVVDQQVDEITSQSIVTIRNNSSCIFDGMVHVWFSGAGGKSIGSDTIFVEQLPPGQYTYARIDLDSTESVSGAYEFGPCTFEDLPEISADAVDVTLSDQLAAAFEESFGGAGTPEYATSWYKYLISVSVYTSDAGNRAVVTVTPGDQDGIQMICKSLLWNFAEEYNLLSVEAVNEAGESLFLFSA